MSLVVDGPRPASRTGWLAMVFIGTAAAAVIGTFSWLGSFSLAGLALIALLAPATLVALLYLTPGAFLVFVPASLPYAALGPVFPLEIAFAFGFGLALLRLIKDRAARLTQLGPIETAFGAFVLWAAITGLWSTDMDWYLRGLRRLSLGFATLWLASRLPSLLSRRAYTWSLILGAAAIAAAALAKRVSIGLSITQAMSYSRAEATDLGWGTANYIASLLLLMSPLMLDLAQRPAGRLQRPFAWVTLVAIAFVQGVVASRAAAVLFALGMLAQVLRLRSRRDVLPLLVVVSGVVALFASPLGGAILYRFSSVRELGSMTVRIWYTRVALHRVVDNLPWGMGLFQGWVYPDRLYGIDTHDYWLTVASELGLPGFVLWCAVLAMIIRAISSLGRDPEQKAIARALGVAFTVSQLHTLVEPTFQGLQYQFLYFWTIGGSLAYAEAQASSRR